MSGATWAVRIRRATVATTVLCVLVIGRSATAQTPPTTLPSVAVPPTSVLVPNYNGVPIGEIGGLVRELPIGQPTTTVHVGGLGFV